MLPSIGRRACPSQNQTSPLTRFLLVILMIVKEASYLSLERRRLLQVTDGTGAVEELPLELRGDSIPAHEHSRAQALQNLLFFLGKGSTVVAILSPLNRLIEMNRHPFFVFGKRRVGLLEIAEFTRFVRRTRYVDKQRPEFGCFGSILLRSEHLTRPFCGKREVDQTIWRLLKLLKPPFSVLARIIHRGRARRCEPLR
jgi:hypothetical protein